MNFQVLLCALFSISVQAGHIPAEIAELLCSKSLPQDEFNQCAKDGLTNARPFLIEGVPELHIPAIDPLMLEHLNLDTNVGSMLRIQGELSNVVITGGGEYEVRAVDANPNTLEGTGTLLLKHIDFELDYDLDGKIALISLKNKGHMVGSLDNLEIDLDGNLVLEDDIFQVGSIEPSASITGGEVTLKSDDPDKQGKADAIMDFFNDDPVGFVKLINPVIKIAGNRIIQEYGNHILESAPASEWLPE